MLLQEPVQAAIWDALNHYSIRDATFLAERLYAEVKNDDAIFLLATCYYRAGKSKKAYSLLQTRGCSTPQCKYLLARCCVQIDKLSEAENVLAGSVLTKCKTHDEIISEFGNSACYIFSLLGHIYSKTERTAKACECYRKSLKLNPLLWASFERLCQMGEKVDSTQVFQLPDQGLSHGNVQGLVSSGQAPPTTLQRLPQTTGLPSHNTSLSDGSSPVITECRPQTPVPQHTDIILHPGTPDNPLPSMGSYVETPASPEPSNLLSASLTSRRRNRVVERNLSGIPLTPSFGILPLSSDTPSPGEGSFTSNLPFITPSPTALTETQHLPPRLPRKKRTQNQNQKPFNSDLALDMTSLLRSNSSSTQTGLTSNITNVRRSTRLFTNSNSVKENNKSQAKTKFSSPKAPGRKSKTRLSKSQHELNEINKSEQSVDAKNAANSDVAAEVQLAQLQRQSLVGILSLLQSIGKAFQAQCQYECQKAIDLYSDLPPQQYNTAWVLSQIGREYTELNQYQRAEKVFSEVRQLEPHHLEGMEMYSTTLWHLHREVQLSALAQDLTELDKNSPEAWCAAGNCFSLQKEHDTAIKFFQRAIQVAPDFAYSYTLLGHEYVLTEELDKALSCFRNAIRVDPRHYNARYGVGLIYYKQEKFNLAEVHFRKALSIYPESSVLVCHIGVVQHALQKTESALKTLNRAMAIDPHNPLCKFHRASILFANDRHKEALSELEELKEIVPKESLVYFLIGKVHKKLGNTHLAMMNFSWAMDLDPKGANNQIKEAIDKRYVTEDEDSMSRLNDSDIEEENTALAEAQAQLGLQFPSFVVQEDVQLQAMESDESL
ncbi:cell division cycle protein 27 homolog [Liolophura sinensis]|uniref:cell division cycle protein 27 homolog n=1 Tax=Liolophura sinensis TaxID=3198878 RepID=UPI0031590CA8